jgi:carboxymethylenebutenolidase
MHDRTVAIPTRAGQMETFITHPKEGGPFPAVVIYMDFWGVREELFDIARRVGTVGYYCVVPDLYYRQGRVRHEWRNEKNQMISMGTISIRRASAQRWFPSKSCRMRWSSKIPVH